MITGVLCSDACSRHDWGQKARRGRMGPRVRGQAKAKAGPRGCSPTSASTLRPIGLQAPCGRTDAGLALPTYRASSSRVIGVGVCASAHARNCSTKARRGLGRPGREGKEGAQCCDAGRLPPRAGALNPQDEQFQPKTCSAFCVACRRPLAGPWRTTSRSAGSPFPDASRDNA